MQIIKFVWLSSIFINPIIGSSNSGNNSCISNGESIKRNSNTLQESLGSKIRNVQKKIGALNKKIFFHKHCSIIEKAKNDFQRLKINHRKNIDRKRLEILNDFIKKYRISLLYYNLNINELANISFMEFLKHRINKYISLISDLNQQNRDGQTALHIAVHYQIYEIVKLLIEAGSDIDKENSDGQTALHIAACCHNYKIVNLLIEAGANLNRKSHYGQTALSLAKLFRNNKVLELLIKSGSDLYYAYLSELDFRAAKFDNINFGYSDLRATDFSKANLGDSDFRGAFLIGAKFVGANLNRAVMERKQLNNLSLNYSGTIIVWEDFIKDCLIPKWERELLVELPKDISLFIISSSCYLENKFLK